MSTRIDINVAADLLRRLNRSQSQANRQSLSERERRDRLTQQGTALRQQQNAAAGLNFDGSIYRRRPTRPRFLEEPAATPMLIKADYYVIEYSFTTGRDLDTRTKLLNPETLTLSEPIGWCKGWQVAYETEQGTQVVLEWGGDNTGTGVESVLYDRKAYEAVFGVSKKALIALNAFWYGERGSGVTIKVTGYKGGEMVPDGFAWRNDTATRVWQNFSTYPTSSVVTNLSKCIDGDFVAYLEVDYARGKISYNQELS